MATHETIFKSVPELLAKLQECEEELIVAYFYGTPPPSGDHWCSDCSASKDKINIASSLGSSHILFIKIEVGDKDTWKKQDNEFRVSQFGIDRIPTLLLIKRNDNQSFEYLTRLREVECIDEDNLKKLFNGK